MLVLSSAFSVLSSVPGAAQGRISNAKTETRSAAQGLEREVRAASARPGVTWIGYRMPMVAGPRQMCCFDTISDTSFSGGMCRLESGGGVSMNTGDFRDRNGLRIALEPATEFLVMARLEGGTVTRVRTFTPDCDIDATAMPLVWLDDVKPDESIAWLGSLVAASPVSGDQPRSRRQDGDERGRDARRRGRGPRARRLRRRRRARSGCARETAFWLGSARGEPGARLLARMITQDPSDKVRDKAAFGLSVSKAPLALTTLIAAAKDDKSTRVRSQALFWLAQRAGKEAIAAITNAIDNDPETEVKKKAVFALSQLPKDEGVPKLMEIARTNRNPEVRKQAMFWLGQTKDPRAVKFFEEILTRK